MDPIEIVHTTPSKIIIRSGERTATISGEALTRLPGEPDFVIYAGTLKNWQIGKNIEEITLPERNRILEEVENQLTRRGWRIEIEE